MPSAARRVLVTGADGFIGSHLVERLLAVGHEVAAVVRATSVVGTSELRLRNLAGCRSRLAAVIAVDIAGGDALARRVVAFREVEVAIEHGPARAAEVTRLCCDPNVAQALGWRARIGLDEGLRRNIAWTREQR